MPPEQRYGRGKEKDAGVRSLALLDQVPGGVSCSTFRQTVVFMIFRLSSSCMMLTGHSLLSRLVNNLLSPSGDMNLLPRYQFF